MRTVVTSSYQFSKVSEQNKYTTATSLEIVASSFGVSFLTMLLETIATVTLVFLYHLNKSNEELQDRKISSTKCYNLGNRKSETRIEIK